MYVFFRRDNNVIPGNDKPLINNIVILKPRSKSTLELAQLRASLNTHKRIPQKRRWSFPQIMVRNVSNPGVFLIVFVSVLSTHTAYCAKRYLRWWRFLERCPSVVCCLLSQILVIFCKGICTGVRHMLTGVLIKRLTICCFSPKWTSFISELGAVTVDSGSQFLVIFTKSDQFHQRVRGGKAGMAFPPQRDGGAVK